MDTYSIIQDAIRNKHSISADYKGYHREMSPHLIGTKRGDAHLLSYQYGGNSSSGLPPGGNWRCMDVEKIQNVRILEGVWHTGSSHTRPQNCVDEVDTVVPY